MPKELPPGFESVILDEIQQASERYENAKNSRVRMVQLARDAGVTWEAITARAGTSRSNLIQLLQRAAR